MPSSPTIETQVAAYLESLSQEKSREMALLHSTILERKPGVRLWYQDGKDEQGKVVTNPSIGYGCYEIRYADGSTKEFFQVGISANTTGISVYIMGLADKGFLKRTYGDRIGKATVTGYCIKFKNLSQIDLPTLIEAMENGLGNHQQSRNG